MSSNGALEDAVLPQILSALKQLQQENAELRASVEAIGAKFDVSRSIQSYRLPSATSAHANPHEAIAKDSPSLDPQHPTRVASDQVSSSSPAVSRPSDLKISESVSPAPFNRRPSGTTRIILTTYPGQSGIDPLPMQWGEFDADKRGPVVVSRQSSSIRRRNAIGAHGGSYSIYHALAVGSKNLLLDHKPDFTNTEPAVQIGPFPSWGNKKKIVSMDPWGHLAPWIFEETIKSEDVEIRPTIAITKAHMKLPELEESVRKGRLVPDGKICLNNTGELAVHKEAVKEAQKGGSGVVIYFRKEGRALGEVTKYLVYNARKRGSDKASEYFKRTENIAGVKDMRFQALMPDILHWLGIQKIDRMLSMSNMKHDAIVEQGIPIHERVPIPDEMIPEDSRVEIDAKIHAGYFTTGKILSMDELAAVQGRAWDDIDH
ncbi:MAG: hypothetical protein Q9227_006479 [Pyrenula ochraceoflavens]